MFAQFDFWDGFLLLLIWLPLVTVWCFAVFDIFRRDDLGGWSKALWIIAVIFFPWLGVLIYLILRPVTRKDVEMQQAYLQQREYARAAHAADKLAKLSELLERGDITREEFEREKAKLLSK